MAITNPTKYVTTRRLGRFKQKSDLLYAPASTVLTPVDASTLTPSSTFKKGDVLGINGVIYKCTADTSNFPVTMTIENNQLVYNTVNGKKAYVISDYTLKSGWEIWTDASIEYWVNSVNGRADALGTRITALETALNGVMNGVTIDGNTYTIEEVLTAALTVLSKTVVVQNNSNN